MPDQLVAEPHGAILQACDVLADESGPLPPTTCRVPVACWRAGSQGFVRHETSDQVIDEVPVALVYNGISQAVMLASPQDLEDFAIGFSLTERIVATPDAIFELDTVTHALGIEVRLRIDGMAMRQLQQARRMRAGKTGCGLCGIDSLEHFDAVAGNVPPGGSFKACALHRAVACLAERQPIHAATGAAHAAGWADQDGVLQVVREDVGRHNALDKLIGAVVRAGLDRRSGFAVVTSRASFEMVQKAARAGMGVLAAVSAPTAMAIRMADAAGLTLTGFVRSQQHVVYTHAHRLLEC